MLISAPEQISLAYLEQLLQEQDSTVRLSGFELIPLSASHASVYRLLLNYHQQGSAPESLFLKICRLNQHFVADSEILYYTRDYLQLPQAPLLKCYAAAGDQTGYSLLLQDISQSHYSNKDIPPSAEHVKAVSKALAQLHAPYWGQPTTSAQVSAYFEHCLPATAPVLKALKDSWSFAERQLLVHYLEQATESLRTRLQHPSGQTLLHGDPNPSNVLSPHQAEGQTYLIDRQPFVWSLLNGLGVMDLVYMSVPYWSIEDRRSFEFPLLEQYHQELMLQGVENYSLEDCLSDYHEALVLGLCVGLSWQGQPEMRWLWERQLARTLQALKDWDE